VRRVAAGELAQQIRHDATVPDVVERIFEVCRRVEVRRPLRESLRYLGFLGAPGATETIAVSRTGGGGSQLRTSLASRISLLTGKLQGISRNSARSDEWEARFARQIGLSVMISLLD